MYCEKCGARLDIKYKQCPKCMEKIRLKKRLIEYKELKKYSRKNLKEVEANEKISSIREAENVKAHFGRKKRKDNIRTSNAIFVLIGVMLAGFIISSVVYDKYTNENQSYSDNVATATDATATDAITDNMGEYEEVNPEMSGTFETE